ncbi:hypothetical protein QAD02_017404 [Eretmocerus hayati]|uniref:Uncharacterized protein n=1 Tax=Eretmocerus hayati TaxID=131215 RepID=A0ACC2PGQ2_9HYME|nr:hypothetical protein QAD02_017404 [Eretmocerus hayati]
MQTADGIVCSYCWPEQKNFSILSSYNAHVSKNHANLHQSHSFIPGSSTSDLSRHRSEPLSPVVSTEDLTRKNPQGDLEKNVTEILVCAGTSGIAHRVNPLGNDSFIHDEEMRYINMSDREHNEVQGGSDSRVN